ncbi:phosphatase PAP2 family protein [Paucibacter sediminis]|uniref:Phosphatase PAP2 family protein n=1 Tax=Paucibacter sediminis TaxID=3019553 RepID=A0AA95N979_9BURK|nr:vanadium-dependent haloperoxidase [Paucibacter sp. S2-9]WIT10737.1 phosphatase PAP2 family protein [Paucibacter sp. S2-9]
MTHLPHMPMTTLAVLCACCLSTACGGGSDDAPAQPLQPSVTPQPEQTVTITTVGPNAVSYWNEVATTVINLPAAATGTAEEQRPNLAVDLATVHLAIYDAVMAIAGTHRSYAITPSSGSASASQEAAVASAAYQVLLGLFPSRSAQFQPAYDSYLASLPDNAARAQGLAIGAEVASGMLALRAADGRSVVLTAYQPGNAPGQFRGNNPIGRPNPFIKPFVLNSTSQFRAPGPAALGSAGYAADVNETMSLGAANSSTRSAQQTEAARFHTEPPPLFWPRNMRNFAMTNRSVAEHARLMALIWVAQADAQNACFESKYYHQAWRPASAITLADTDGNAATTADLAWVPVVPTPNHPEYPAAHSCISAAMAEVLSGYYGTSKVSFDFNSTVTGSTHHFSTTADLVSEVQMARIAGGMHFRTATVDGAALGKSVGGWVLAHAFQPR